MTTKKLDPQAKEIKRLLAAASEYESDAEELDMEDPFHPDKDWKLEEAELCYREVLKLDPQHFEALLQLGRHFVNLDAPDEALVHLETAAKIRPNDEDLVHYLKRAREEKAAGRD